MAVSFHLSGESPDCDGMMTSKVVRPGPTGWRPRIIQGSTSPSTYPCMSSTKQLACRKSSSIARSRKGIFLGASSPARFGQAMLISCGFWPFSVGLARNWGAILLAQLAGNHASKEEAPLERSTMPVSRLCGRSVTNTFTGPLGARFLLTSALFGCSNKFR